MKKLFIAASAIAALTLTGCANTDDKPEKAAQVQSVETKAPSPAPTKAPKKVAVKKTAPKTKEAVAVKTVEPVTVPAPAPAPVTEAPVPVAVVAPVQAAPVAPVATTPAPAPKPVKQAPVAAPKVETAAVPSSGGLNWSALANCESGGNPSAVSPAGYGGLYQFDASTWASVGGSGSPAAASASEQTKRAQMLYAQRGSSPWPVCGAQL